MKLVYGEVGADERVTGEISQWEKDHAARFAHASLTSNIDTIQEHTGRPLNDSMLFGGRDVVFGVAEKDVAFGQLYLFDRLSSVLRCVLTNNVVLGMIRVVDLDYDVDLALDVTAKYATAYTIAASSRTTPKNLEDTLDEAFWSEIVGDIKTQRPTIESYRYAAGVLQLAFDDKLDAEVPESPHSPLHVLALANPMSQKEVRQHTTQLQW